MAKNDKLPKQETAADNYEVLAVDLGFSAVKWRYKGKQGLFPSAFRPAHKPRYLVGDDALKTSGSSYLKTAPELVKFYYLFVAKAAELAGVEDLKKTVVAVGLPLSFWEKEGHAGGAIESLKSSLSQELEVADVYVLPQGLGGLMAWTSEHESNDTSQRVLVVDIGFNTLIFALYKTEGFERVYGRTITSRGITELCKNLLFPAIEHHAPGKDYTPLEMSGLLRLGEMKLGFNETIDIKAEIHQAAERYYEQIMNDIAGELEAELGAVESRFNMVLFFGGGAAIFRDVISENTSFVVLENPEFGNVRGFELAAQQIVAEG